MCTNFEHTYLSVIVRKFNASFEVSQIRTDC